MTVTFLRAGLTDPPSFKHALVTAKLRWSDQLAKAAKVAQATPLTFTPLTFLLLNAGC